ncbi:MAG: exonuclease domain-containing protein [Pseudorhodobacter sp.]
MLSRLGLRLRIFLFFAALALGAVTIMGAGLALAYRRAAAPELLGAFVQGGLIGGFGILGLTVWIWYLFDINLARPIGALAASLRARTHAGAGGEVASARYLGDLAPAAASAADQLARTRSALSEHVARETTRLATEKARLEALLSDVAAGVLVCSGEHRIVFYNGSASALMGGMPGLDRDLFELLHDGPIREARDRLLETGDGDAASDLLCSTRDGARLLAARMRLLPATAKAAPGYVLTLRDATAEIAAQTEAMAARSALLEGVRRPVSNLNALLAALPEDSPPPSDLVLALQAEIHGLSGQVRDLAAGQEENPLAGQPFQITRASDLMDGLRARIEAGGGEVEVTNDALLLRCNGFEIVALMAYLAAKLQQGQIAGRFYLELTESGALALLRLRWTGAVLPVARLEEWLIGIPDPGRPQRSAGDVVRAHATEIWPETGPDGAAMICLPLRLARLAGPRPEPVMRRVVYDFDLLEKPQEADLARRRLADLVYVVFDTETTGLMPDQGDEIVQIAAMRIVNGRLVAGEILNRLVNPGRSIPAVSTRVHGITDEMVADAPDITRVGRIFRQFARDAVLIAHNAPFDMAFLRRHEAGIGASFDHPVLDTVLISAVLFGQHEPHDLDALCHRLGITIPEEARHTALGDTRATAEAFLRMLPMLEARGIVTFGELLHQMRRHRRLLRDLN